MEAIKRLKRATHYLFGGGKQRECSECHETYFRRNLEERWFFSPGTNGAPGKWGKRTMKVCLRCSRLEGIQYVKPSATKPNWISGTDKKVDTPKGI